MQDFPTADPDFSSLTIETRRTIERAIMGAVADHGHLSTLQRRILRAVSSSILGVRVDVDHASPASPEELAAALAQTTEPVRHRVVQFMLMLELVLQPLPESVAHQVETYAAALDIEDDLLVVARDYAHGAYGLALKDIERNGYFHHWDEHGELEDKLHVQKRLVQPFEAFAADEALHQRWQGLRDCPMGSLGRAVWEFYRARGFSFPGAPDSVSPVLAQHDFLHVVADYASTIDGEVETFAFISAAIPDPRGFSWLATILGLFETGHVPRAAGILEADLGHLDEPGMCIRLADALRRGRLVEHDVMGDVDWFELAQLPLAQVRERLNVVPKDASAVHAGSASAFQRAGMSPYQLDHGDVTYQPAS